MSAPRDYSDSSPGGVAFSCNRSIPLNLRQSSRAFDYNAELGTFVFALKTGSISFISNMFEFDIENPVDGQEIKDVCFAAQFGIVISVSTKLLQVWDIFREVVGMRIKPVHAVAVPSKPKCIHVVKRDNSCFIGLESGRMMVIDIAVCASGIPRYVCTPYLELSTCSLTAIECSSDELYMLVGTEEGVVKVIRYDSKKVTLTTKPPPRADAVSSITIVASNVLPSFLVSFTASKFIAVYQEGSLTSTVDLPLPALRAFASSVSSGPLFVELSDGSLFRQYGSGWSLSAPLAVRCIATKLLDADSFLTLELDVLNSTTVLRQRALVSGEICDSSTGLVGSLGLTNLNSPTPAATVCFSRHDRGMEPHLIRLANDLTKWPSSPTSRFVHEWNDGKWEGILISAFNAEIVFSIYSHSTQRVLSRMKISVPELSVISAISVLCIENDRWSIALGFSSGRIALLESRKDPVQSPQIRHILNPAETAQPSASLLVWQPLQYLDISVHEGCKIRSIDRSLWNLLVSVDTNGLVCFTRLKVSKKSDTGPAHVAIAGEGGVCFTDPKTHLAYICMADGTIERMKTPRRKPDGTEDMYDSDVFEAQTIAESVPLDGEFVAVFPAIGIAVRETGVVALAFPRQMGMMATVNKSVGLREDGGTRILAAKTHIAGSHCYVVILTDTSVAAFDVTDGGIVPVFQRSHLVENPTEILPFFTDSLHFIKWGVSITSVLFADRVKDMISGETVISCAQKHFGFPPIQSTSLLVEKEPKTGVAGAKKESLFGRMFRKPDTPKDDGILGGENLKKYIPTEVHLQEARKQLAANLDAMAKLRENAADMEHSSSDFLKLTTELNQKMAAPKKKKFGLF